MSSPDPVRVLVIGDPYMPLSAYAEPLARLGDEVNVTSMQIEGVAFAPPRTESEHRLREYVGDPADVARAVAGHDVLIVHGAPVSAEVLDAAPLRLVCVARGGPVNVDVAAATDRGIPVVNTPGKNAEAVAELTIAFALLLIRAVPRASSDLLRRGAFAESVFEGSEYIGQEATSVTLGLVGLGQVGREVAARARALGFTVLAYDPLVTEAADGVALVPLDTLLDRSDIVSVHARATAENRHMFTRAAFTRMRPGAFFINTARESLVDEAALGRRWRKEFWRARHWMCWNGRSPAPGIPCWTRRTCSSPRTSAGPRRRRWPAAPAARWPRWPAWWPGGCPPTW